MLRKFGCALILILLVCACACGEGAYDETRQLGGGYIAVSSGGKWGVVSAEGVTILPVENDIVYLAPDGELLYYREGEVWSIRLEGDFSGANEAATAGPLSVVTIAPTPFATPTPRPTLDPDAPYHLAFGKHGDYIIAHRVTDAEALANGYGPGDGLQGIANKDGELILPCRFDQIEFNDTNDGGRLYAHNGSESSIMYFRLDGDEISFYAKDKDGNEIPLPDWSMDWAQVIPLSSEPVTYLALWLRDSGNSHWALLDAEGGVKNKRYLETEPNFIDGVANVEQHDLEGFLRSDGSWLVRPRFERAYPFSEGFAFVRENGRCGYIDLSGEYLVEPMYDSADSFFENGFARVGQGEKLGVISSAGNLVLPVKYDSLSSISYDRTVTATRDGESTIFRLTETGAEEVKSVGSDLILEDYMPFTGKKLAKLGEEPTLENRASADHGHPRLDGATALFPVYSAIVEAVYPEKTRYAEEDKNPLVTCTKTNRAYERLIEGKADIIFCAGPSDAQVAMAKAMGVEFELTPFGREAFVFIVNKENPMNDISVENIRRVYSGEITEWDALGVNGLGEVVAYQRPDNSGSQTALERLMGETPIMEAPSERISSFMDDIIETIEYRNLPNAIGYTFRFFCTEMIGSDVKLLSIDGVEPSLENIRSDRYPITSTLYMVTRKGEDNPNVQALIDWVLSDQGQKLVEKAGYVGVN